MSVLILRHRALGLGMTAALLFLFPFSLLASSVSWKNATELSYVNTTGNSRSATLGAQNKFHGENPHWKMELDGSALRARSEGSVVSEKYKAGEKVSWRTFPHGYLFEKFVWDKNRFAGNRNRYRGSLGVGYGLVRDKRHSLTVEVGGGYVNESRIGEPRNEFALGQASGHYAFTLSETSDINLQGDYAHNFEEANDFRLNVTASLTARISTHLALKTSYLWERVNVPPAGFGKNDTTTSVALLFHYGSASKK